MMAITTSERNAVVANKPEMKSPAPKQVDDISSDGDSSPRSSSPVSVFKTEPNSKTQSNRQKMTLKQRGAIPPSICVSLTLIVLVQVFGGVFSLETLFSLHSSVTTSIKAVYDLLAYQRDLFQSIASGEQRETLEYVISFAWMIVLSCIFYVLIYSPFRAGMWTGQRAKRHLVHRYMGLLFLTQYTLAWVEYLTNYEEAGRTTYFPHTIALNGLIQVWSAYFSFKVLPELDDAGYYSDKAVLSRNFVHENAFYQLMVVFGSLYYNDGVRTSLRTSTAGRILEGIFVFWPYIVLRPWFPTTRFKDAGKSRAGRSEKNFQWYAYATTLVKIFYLWAKYFLGFFINFVVYLGVATEDNMRFIRGLYLLNCGTVSIAVFLHTLRFKKVLPPRLMFSLYLLQIYASFSAIPFAYDLFNDHRQLCGLALTGILCNMTRDRRIHGVWCAASTYLLAFTDVKW